MRQISNESTFADKYLQKLETDQGLLCRLREFNKDPDWSQFYETYWRPIFNFARRMGLNDQEAEDVVQETMIAAAKAMPAFHYDPRKGTFRSWIYTIARHQISNFNRKKAPESRLLQRSWTKFAQQGKAATIDDLADPNAPMFSHIWNQEWKDNIFKTADQIVRRTVDPKHYQMFDLGLKGRKAEDIARFFRVSRAAVYVAQCRVRAALRREIKRLSSEPPVYWKRLL